MLAYRSVKSMLGPDIPEECFLGIGVAGAPAKEIILTSRRTQELLVKQHVQQSDRAHAQLLASFLAYFLNQAGLEQALFLAATVAEVLNTWGLSIRVNPNTGDLMLIPVPRKEMNDGQDSSEGLETSVECSQSTE